MQMFGLFSPMMNSLGYTPSCPVETINGQRGNGRFVDCPSFNASDKTVFVNLLFLSNDNVYDDIIMVLTEYPAVYHDTVITVRFIEKK